ncbi:MAG TPA: YraN family protein [Thermodesulfobacteriota bacterium]|nr:YraN family protein [Thermodesulfobacteriota bacterium]
MTRERLSLGEEGEQLALNRLENLKYKILERNFKCPLGEIDIIARDRNTLVFVEVKTRATRDFGGPAAAVNPRKQRQLSRVALVYLSQKKLHHVPARFDVVSIELTPPSPKIEVIENAFELCYG